MLLPVFPPYRPRSRGARKPRRPAPPLQVTVLSVTVSADNQLTFAFSRPVTCDGTGSPFIVVPDSNLGEIAALFSNQVSATSVSFDFDGAAVFAAGMHWEIEGVPACLDLNGATMPVPQGGVVA